jgi:hypothetical protein
MIQKFPLYESLLLEAKGRKTKEWGKICLIINNLNDSKSLEIIYALIYHHLLLESGDAKESNILPYGSKLLAKDRAPKFEINELPPILAEIIALYVNLLIE